VAPEAAELEPVVLPVLVPVLDPVLPLLLPLEEELPLLAEELLLPPQAIMSVKARKPVRRQTTKRNWRGPDLEFIYHPSSCRLDGVDAAGC
jgi:hypothetical protein